MAAGADEETAATWSTVALICGAQLITGLGWYNTLGKIGGAGAAVPITGFANSVVSPALEYKKKASSSGRERRYSASPVRYLRLDFPFRPRRESYINCWAQCEYGRHEEHVGNKICRRVGERPLNTADVRP